MNKNKILSVSLIVIIYLIFTGITYILFSKPAAVKVASPVTTASGQLAFNNALPKTEACPMNGTLYSRSGTRWYAKRVVNGKGVDYELSEEEKKSLKEASSNL